MLEPRLDPDEIEYLKDFMANKADGTKMVEWGSGGSTAMFVPYFKTGRFMSVEHNHEWFDKVKKELESGEYAPECLANFTYAFIPPIVDIRFYGYGVPHEENPCFAKDYINPQIMDTGDQLLDIWDSDIFFVDGICRGAILATIRAKAKKPLRNYDDRTGRWTDPATVFIHDYYGPEMREPWYSWASSLYSKVERVGNSLARLYL
jgi:hypothetical protein